MLPAALVLRPSVLALCLVLASCGGDPPATLVTPGPGAASGAPTTSPAATVTPSPNPSAPAVTFEQPTDGASVPAGDLTLSVKIANFQLVDKIGNPPAPGEGHVVFYVGVDYVPTSPGRLAHTAAGTFAVSTAPQYTWSGLTAGTYGIAAQLVNNDDSALQPPAVARATITVQ